MKVAVTSTVLFEVPDDGSTLRQIRERFYLANVIAIGLPMQTVNGQEYVMYRIEALDVERRPNQ